MKKFNYEKNYFYFSLVIMVILGGFLVYSLLMFLNAILGAIIMYILTKPIMVWFTEKKKLNKSLSAVLVIVLSFLVLLLPMLGIGYMLVNKIAALLTNTQDLMAFFEKIQNYISQHIKFDILSDDTLNSIKATLTIVVSTLLSETVAILTDIGFMYFILFFMLVHHGTMENTISFYLPYKQENIQLFKKELKGQTYSNAIGMPLLAFIQGLAAALGYWIFGVDEFIFWGLMTGVFSFLPLVGSMIIWLPLSIFKLASGDTGNGIAIIIYSLIVTGNIDNIFRFILQKKIADVHPLITLLGFIMGIKYFGISGIIIGPVLISCFLIMIDIFKKEFLLSPRQRSVTESNQTE